MSRPVPTSHLAFNIIYTPGSVRYLTVFAQTLLDWSDCSYRLVSNALAADEKALLKSVCASHARLEFIDLPSDTVLLHADALQYLQVRTDEDYFCFMDSDIFATGSFAPELVEQLSRSDVLFSCSPLWCENHDLVLPESFQQMGGVNNVTDTGVCIGSTYFAIYDNKMLSACIAETGIGFGRYYWDELPSEHQATLRSMGLQKHEYDTGKVLNLLLLQRGQRLRVVELKGLCHVGGISETGMRDDEAKRGLGERLAGQLPRPLVGAPMTLADAFYAYMNGFKTSSWAENRVLIKRSRKRKGTSAYFYQLLRALVDDHPFPELPRLGHRGVERQIASVTVKLRDWYANSRSSNPASPDA